MISWDYVTENGLELTRHVNREGQELTFKALMDGVLELKKPVYIPTDMVYKYGVDDGVLKELVTDRGLVYRPLVTVTNGLPFMLGILIGPDETELLTVGEIYNKACTEANSYTKH